MEIEAVKHDRNYSNPGYLDPLLLYTVLQPIITNLQLGNPLPTSSLVI